MVKPALDLLDCDERLYSKFNLFRYPSLNAPFPAQFPTRGQVLIFGNKLTGLGRTDRKTHRPAKVIFFAESARVPGYPDGVLSLLRKTGIVNDLSKLKYFSPHPKQTVSSRS